MESSNLSFEEKLELVKKNTEEIVTEEELKKLLKTKKNPVVYWGTAVTGKPSFAYFFPLLKLGDFIKAGFKVKVLLADLHGALDGTPWNILEHRTEYYKEALKEIFRVIGLDINKIEFVIGSEFQLKPEYNYDVLKLASLNSVHDCRKAAAEVVKSHDNPKLGSLVYPIMQALDEEYLKADAQFGGLDQRKIFMFARENLPKIMYDRRVEIMSPMIPGLIGEKMSSSDPKSKIDLCDDEKLIREKINKAYCEEGNPDNGIMAMLRYIILEIKLNKNEKFLVEREDKYGGDLEYSNYEEIEQDFLKRNLHPMDLKNSVAREITSILSKINKSKLLKLEEKAYSGY